MAFTKGLHIIPVGLLKLDPSNPRLPERLLNAPESEVLNWMLSDSTLTDLMASIVENNFFSGESLIGINDEIEPGKVTIVEGNRRLASVKLLINPDLATNKAKTVASLARESSAKNNTPSSLPVYVVDKRVDVENYLGFRHVSGVKEWPVIAKARYLYSLFTSRNAGDPNIYKILAKEIGSKAGYVKRLIIGYQIFEKIRKQGFYDLDYLSEETFDLSLITDAATKYPEIAEYIGVDPNSQKPLGNINDHNFKSVFSWLYERDEHGETRLGESRNLSVLSKILASPEATKAFVLNGYTLIDAAALTTLADENIRWYLQSARTSMIEAQKLVHTIQAPIRSDIRLIDEIRSSAETLRREIGLKVIDKENI
jgi:hypothetical protein